MEIIEAKQGCVYIIGYVYRPGCVSFSVELEHVHYPPDTDLNTLYQIFSVKYNDMMHYVIEIKKNNTSIEQCYKLSCKHNLKLVSGKPWNGTDEFPVKCMPEACFTLETIKHDKYTEQDLKYVIQSEVKTLKDKYRID
uniref:Uncharacterized protein n=1 Tax=viral metagenome TaxID=1070528 RepID=A0A6C0J4H9_9ZZZZ